MVSTVTVTSNVVPLDTGHVAGRLEKADPRDVIAWAVTTVPRVAVTSSFGADAAVLLSFVAQVDPSIPVLFLDTGFHFGVTLRYRRELTEHLGLTDVRDIQPRHTVLQQALRHGPELYKRDPDLCCRQRKVVPLDLALEGFDGWATGVRRDQTAERSDTPVVQTVLRAGRILVKIAPLACWTAADIRAYMERENLPQHPLVAAGYPSIGCEPCTRPVADGDDPRAGRWAESTKTECGLHALYARSEV